MPIASGDLEFYLTKVGGGAQSDPDDSIGGQPSSTTITDSTDNNLWDDVTGDEASSGDTEYRCIALQNDHGSITLENSKLWFTSNTTSADDTLDIALAAAGLNSNPERLSDESTAPSGGETFSAPASKAAGLSVGNVPNGQFYGIFIRRTVNASSSALDANAATLKWEGDSSA